MLTGKSDKEHLHKKVICNKCGQVFRYELLKVDTCGFKLCPYCKSVSVCYFEMPKRIIEE